MAAPEDNKGNPHGHVEISQISLYQAGQDTVQNIIQLAQEIFQALKLTQFPNGTGAGQHRLAAERSNKLRELLEKIECNFKKLRVICIECQKNAVDGQTNAQSLIPLCGPDNEEKEKDSSLKSTKELMLENRKRELEEQIRMKNEQMEKLLSQMRELVWNTSAVITSVT